MQQTPLVFPAMFGGLLGIVYFGGLWWTVRRGLLSTHPELWFVVSMLFRMAFVLAGFYWMATRGFMPLVMCLLGFVAAKLFVTLFIRPPLAGGTTHAN